MQAAPSAIAAALALAACLYASQSAPAQDSTQPVQNPQLASVDLVSVGADPIPSAPSPSLAPSDSQPAQIAQPGHLVTPATQPGPPVSLHDRFALEARTTFGPSAFIVPAGEAAITMADPPHHYPHAWSDGGGAFGRNYGAEFVRHTTGGLTHFAVAAILREDPSYHPSTSTNYGARALHAFAFTLVDRSDSGRHTIAFSNLAGSAGAGFIGMAYYPDGFNDLTHAYQRAAVEVTNFAAHNLIAEFSPELAALAHKLHFPDRIADSFLPPDRKP